MLAHLGRSDMAHGQVHTSPACRIALAHLAVDGPAHDIARAALAELVVPEHEPAPVGAEQMPTRATEPFLKHGSCHPGVVSAEKSGGVKLHHLHVSRREAESERHGQTVHALVAGRRVVAIHGGATAGGHQNRSCTNESEYAATHVDEQDAGQAVACPARNQCDGAVLFHPLDRAAEHLLHQPADNLDAREVALVNRPIERLSGEGLVVQRTIRISVEEAADFVLELAHPHDCGLAKPPRDGLVRQPLATDDGVHEVTFHPGLFRCPVRG